MTEAVAITPLLTPAQILARLLTVDGTGTGLDADYLRGAGPAGTPPIPGGISGVPLYGQVFQAQRPSSYPASLFKV